jgi:threonine dehydrogenase-like Zn-dependent dehydrogenase
MSEPFAAAVQAVTEIARIAIGDTVLVSGPGPIGLLCLKLLVAQGIKTIVVGASSDGERLDAAKRFGAFATVDLGSQKLQDAINENTKGQGVDVAFECAGVSDSVRGCLDSLRPMGQYVQVAICGQDIQFPIDRIFYEQLTMSGSVCYTSNTWERMMKICASARRASSKILVVGINDESAIGAVETVKAIKGPNQIAIVGHGGSAEIMDIIKDPKSPCIGVVSFNSDRYGSELFNFTLPIVQGRSAPTGQYVPHKFIGRAAGK